MRKTRTTCLVMICALIAAAAVSVQPLSAQSVFASGLNSPTKVILTSHGNLLVAEGGTFSATSTGRVSFIERTGAVRTLIEGLPSGVEPAGSPLGPSGLGLLGRTLFIVISAGDVTVTSDTPGIDAPNPMGPSSPILSSILRVRFSRRVDDLQSGFSLSLEDHFTIANGNRLRLENAQGDRADFKLVADFRDLVRDPAINVRRTNPFAIALDLRRRAAWIADASQNSIERVSLISGRIRRLLELAPVANPLPFGPPFTEAVPTSVRLLGRDLIVAQETGFPFAQGVATVERIDVSQASQETFIPGLTQALDVLQAGRGSSVFFVVELSVNLLGDPPGPGRLLRFASPDAAPQVLADNLTFPTSVAFDDATGELFVTEVATGNVVLIALP